MNLGDIRLAIYDRLGYNSNVDSPVTRRLDHYINTSHKEIVTRKQMGKLRRWVLPFTCTANSPYVVLPQSAAQVICIVDRVNNRPLDEISLQDLRIRDPGLTFAGSIPDSYVVLNTASSVAVDPSTASQLYAVSDSVSDGPGLSVLVEGMITGGYYRRASVGLNGLTPVALDNNSTWIHVTKFYLSGKSTGNVTLTQGSGGNELSRVSQGRSRARYTTLHLSGTPSTAITYYADVELHIEDLVNPSDEPYTPEDYDWLLECGALRLEYLRRGGSSLQQYAAENARWTMGVKDLQAWVTRQTGIARKDNKRSQFSQLPWNFPASPY